MNNLDNLIKEKFELFQGLRSEEEDQKILEEVQTMCFEDIIYYLSEKLSEEQKNKFTNELDNAQSDETKLSVFSEYLTQIPGYEVELSQRLNTFLDKTSLNGLNISQ